VKKIGLMMIIMPFLAACSAQYTSNGEQHYLQSHNGVDLVIPPPQSTNQVSHFYDLPPDPVNPRVSIVPPKST
jgi:uncharacterized lipoprotein